MGFELHNLVCFIGEEADTDGGHVELEQPKQDKPKYEGKKLVKVNLAGNQRCLCMDICLDIRTQLTIGRA